MDVLLHVDDDPLQQAWLRTLFGAEYQVLTFPDAETALRELENETLVPNIAVLDLELPGMSGYQLCRQLREMPQLVGMAILVLSAHDSLPDRVEAYEAGADDYFIKPADVINLRLKLNRLSTLAKERQEIEQYVLQAQQTSFSALSALGETNITLAFFREIAFCRDYNALIQHGLQALHQFGVNAVVELRSRFFAQARASEHDVSPLERSILDHVRTLGNIFEFKQRAVFNFDDVTVLVHDMPASDSERYARLREDISQIAQGMATCAQNIDAMQTMLQQQQRLRHTRATLLAASESLQQQLSQQRRRGEATLQTMTHSLENLIHCFDLREVQEIAIKDILEQSRHDLLDLQEERLDVENVLSDLVSQLDDCC